MKGLSYFEMVLEPYKSFWILSGKLAKFDSKFKFQGSKTHSPLPLVKVMLREMQFHFLKYQYRVRQKYWHPYTQKFSPSKNDMKCHFESFLCSENFWGEGCHTADAPCRSVDSFQRVDQFHSTTYSKLHPLPWSEFMTVTKDCKSTLT